MMVLENFIVDTPIVWDRVGKKIFENPHVKQGRKMRVQITNAGMVEDLSGYTLALGWKHTVSGVDGLDVFEDRSEANVGIFEMAYTENLMTNLGNLKASLVLTSMEDMVVAESNDFYVKVDDSPFGADVEQGVGSFTRLAEILLNEESRIAAEVARVSAEETRVTDFNALVDSEIIAQNVATKLQAKEAEYLPRLVSNEQQLAENKTAEQEGVSEGLKKTTFTKAPFITFVDDDGRTTAHNRLLPLFNSKGVKFVSAIVCDLIGTSGFMTRVQLDNLHANGHEIVSHGVTHGFLSENLTEVKESYDTLNAFGYEVENIVYPGGTYNKNVINECKKYYNCGVSVTRGFNKAPINTFGLNRYAMGALWSNQTFDGILEDGSFTSYKAMVDKAVANNSWLIFMLHSSTLDSDATQLQYIGDTIDYIKSLNVPIVTLKEGIKQYGNRIDVGDADSTHFLIGVDGSIKSSALPKLTKKETSTTITNATPLTSFELGNETITAIWGNASSGFPGSASGILITRYFAHGDISYQEWNPYSYPTGATTYRRRWNTGSSVWGAWTEFTSKSYVDTTIAALPIGSTIAAVNTYNGSTLISGFPNNKITSFAFNNSANPGFPTSAGICTTYRLHNNLWGYQEVQQYGNWGRWIRYAMSDGNWSAWKQVTVV